MSNILLGVTGGIAAYKSASLVRLFVKAGHNVKVMMTSEAERFIGSLTLEALSNNKVMTNSEAPSAIGHIDYASWADICVVAPATANIIGKMASGIADEAVSTTLLAVSCPIVIAPAMNTNMYENNAVQSNLLKLKSWGINVVEPNDGELACGITGKGRMSEPEEIESFVYNILSSEYVKEADVISDVLSGVKILISAGGTREYIDPVRYITNKSSGKMGYALARQAKNMGADVTLVSGVTNINKPDCNVIDVETTEEMFDAVTSKAKDYDIIIMAAAVADYTPEQKSDIKIKKSDENISISLTKTKDILKHLGSTKRDNQILVGFAAETNNVEENAKKKLSNKNADIIVANDVSRSDIGFNSDDNMVTLYFRDGSETNTSKHTKDCIAQIILTESAILLQKN